MKIIISPAKKMMDTSDHFVGLDNPIFIEEAQVVLDELRKMTTQKLKQVLKCNDELVKLNHARYHSQTLKDSHSCAIMAYQGLQYQHLAPHLLEAEALAYLKDRLFILSGLYGVLRPMDRVMLYRLEMQARLSINDHKTLYDYWQPKLGGLFKGELIVNLASREYEMVVPDEVRKRMIHIHFKEGVSDRLISRATTCKMARGRMLRYMAINKVEKAEELKQFKDGFYFSPIHSTANDYVFIKQSITAKDFSLD